MRFKIFTTVMMVAMVIFSGCNVKKQATGFYNLTKCKYDYNSISGLSVADIDLSNGITAMNTIKLASLFTGNNQSIPVNFTINLDVTNNAASAAIMQGMQYIVNIDNIQFTSGSVDQALDIPANGKQVLPLTVGFDLSTFLKGDTKNSVENIAKNFIGIGGEKTNVSVQLRPTFLIGNQRITSPAYIPVNFSFGGK